MRAFIPLAASAFLLGNCTCDPLAADGDGEGEEGEGEEGEGEEGEGEGALGPALCLDGWCWENPRPFAFDIEAVWPIAHDDVWLVVSEGQLLHWDGARFEVAGRLEGAGSFIAPTSLFGTSSTSVWAAAGPLFHFDGTTWSAVEVDPVLERAFTASVFGTADDDLWVIGNPAVIAHFDGTTWTDHTPDGLAAGTLLFSGQALAPDDAWVVGNNDTALHWDGVTWTAHPVGAPDAFLEGVWMSASDDVWAAGRTPSAIFHWDGSTWTPTPAPNARPVSHLWGSAPDDIWGGGPNGVLHHWDGQGWSPVDFLSLPTFQLHAVIGRAVDDIWTVGDGGMIARFDGQRWTRPGQGEALTGLFVDVAGVVVDGAPVVVATGVAPLGGDVVIHRDAGGTWTADHRTPSFMERTSAVALTGPDDIWLGTGEGLLHFDGATWSPVTVPEGIGPAHDLCALADDDAWGLFAVSDGTLDRGLAIGRWDGASWAVEAHLPDVSADASDELTRARLTCLDDGTLWAGGPDFVARRDPAGWVRLGQAPLASGSAHRAAAVGDEVWVVSPTRRFDDGQPVMRFDGADWRLVDLPADIAIHDVDARAEDDVWLAGEQLLRFDGTGLSVVPSSVVSPGNPLRFVSAETGGVLAVGEDGVVHRIAADGTTTTLSGEAPFANEDGADFAVASPTRAFGVGGFGPVYVWTGTAWTEDTQSGLSSPEAVFAFGADDVWIGGGARQLAHFDGATWSTTTLPQRNDSQETVVALFGLPPAELWARGDRGSLWRAADVASGFSVVGTAGDGAAIAGTSSDNVWVIAQTAQRFDGSTLSTPPTLEHPVRIQQVGEALLAVDAFGRVWRRDAAWVPSFVPPGDPARETAAAVIVSPTEAFLLDDSGVLSHLRDGVQTRALSPFFFGLQAIEQVGDDVFVVGGFGAVLRRQR